MLEEPKYLNRSGTQQLGGFLGVLLRNLRPCGERKITGKYDLYFSVHRIVLGCKETASHYKRKQDNHKTHNKKHVTQGSLAVLF